MFLRSYIESMNTDSLSPALTPLIGGHLALDFLNTRYGIDSALRESLVDDRSVMAWMQQVGLLAGQPPEVVPTGLLALAVSLRESVRNLLAAAKAGQSAGT
jgi:predicted RNA-binding Zn ribbon-like protein